MTNIPRLTEALEWFKTNYPKVPTHHQPKTPNLIRTPQYLCFLTGWALYEANTLANTLANTDLLAGELPNCSFQLVGYEAAMNPANVSPRPWTPVIAWTPMLAFLAEYGEIPKELKPREEFTKGYRTGLDRDGGSNGGTYYRDGYARGEVASGGLIPVYNDDVGVMEGSPAKDVTPELPKGLSPMPEDYVENDRSSPVETLHLDARTVANNLLARMFEHSDLPDLLVDLSDAIQMIVKLSFFVPD